MIFSLIELTFFIIMSKNTWFMQIPSVAFLVIYFVSFAQVKSEVVWNNPIILLVEPGEELKLIFKVDIHVIVCILVIMKMSTIFVWAESWGLRNLTLKNFIHIWALLTKIVRRRFFLLNLLWLGNLLCNLCSSWLHYLETLFNVLVLALLWQLWFIIHEPKMLFLLILKV